MRRSGGYWYRLGRLVSRGERVIRNTLGGNSLWAMESTAGWVRMVIGRVYHRLLQTTKFLGRRLRWSKLKEKERGSRLELGSQRRPLSLSAPLQLTSSLEVTEGMLKPLDSNLRTSYQREGSLMPQNLRKVTMEKELLEILRSYSSESRRAEDAVRDAFLLDVSKSLDSYKDDLGFRGLPGNVLPNRFQRSDATGYTGRLERGDDADALLEQAKRNRLH